MKTSVKTLVFTLSLCVITLKTPQSFAGTFIDHDSYLTDLDNKLDWMDVTLTAGLSYAEVTSHLGEHGYLNGWRYATGNELAQLINNFTNSAPTISGIVQGTTDTINYVPSNILDPLVSALGSTLDLEFISTYGSTYDAFYGYEEGEGIDYTFGYTYTPDEDSHLNIAEIKDDEITLFSLIDSSPLSSADYYAINDNAWNRNAAPALNIGSFLVRSTSTQFVPIPSAIWLMVSGFIAIFSLYGKKKV